MFAPTDVGCRALDALCSRRSSREAAAMGKHVVIAGIDATIGSLELIVMQGASARCAFRARSRRKSTVRPI